nr:aromatic peroxygenase [Quercus suber]
MKSGVCLCLDCSALTWSLNPDGLNPWNRQFAQGSSILGFESTSSPDLPHRGEDRQDCPHGCRLAARILASTKENLKNDGYWNVLIGEPHWRVTQHSLATTPRVVDGVKGQNHQNKALLHSKTTSSSNLDAGNCTKRGSEYRKDLEDEKIAKPVALSATPITHHLPVFMIDCEYDTETARLTGGAKSHHDFANEIIVVKMLLEVAIAALTGTQVVQAFPWVVGHVGESRAPRLSARQMPGSAASCPNNRITWVRFRSVQSTHTVGDTAHYYTAPGPLDIRGPCPGLNTAANHNFLSHDGIVTFNELVDAQQNVYGVGYDLAVLLAVLGVGLDGDPVGTTRLSLGCDATSRTSITGTGTELGLDGHNKFEGDTSLTRNDYFTGESSFDTSG